MIKIVMKIIKNLSDFSIKYRKIRNAELNQMKRDLVENLLPKTLLNQYKRNIEEMEFKRDTGIVANQQVIRKLNSLYRDLSKISKITWKEIKFFYEFIDCSGKKAKIKIPPEQRYLGIFLNHLTLISIFFCIFSIFFFFFLNLLDLKIIIEFSVYVFYFIYFSKMSLPVKEAMRYQKLIQKKNI